MDAYHLTRMERETGWSKELVYQLLDNVKDYAIFVADLKGEIVSWNIGAENLFGYTANEIIVWSSRFARSASSHAWRFNRLLSRM